LLAEAMAAKGARVVGLDLAGELLNVARLHALESGVQVDYRLESAEAHAADHAGRYDVVTCMEMLEHVPDPGAVVAALGGLVRPGGEVFVSTLNRTPRAYLMAILGAEYVLRLLPTGTHTYDKFIKPSELRQWARDAGLALVDIAGLGYDPFTRRAWLTTDAAVNYLVHLRRDSATGPA
jgi:2-polyprenyl-6-hydroxyphenyl methylase/3-demethylubiquinone-9 3-methyltransferase